MPKNSQSTHAQARHLSRHHTRRGARNANEQLNAIVSLIETAILEQRNNQERPEWRDTAVPDVETLLNIPQRERAMYRMPEGDDVRLLPCSEPMSLQRCDRNAMKVLKKFRHAPNTFIHAGYRTNLLDEEGEGVPHWVVECNGKMWDVVNAFGGGSNIQWNYLIMNVENYFQWSGWKSERKIRASGYDDLVRMWAQIDAEDN